MNDYFNQLIHRKAELLSAIGKAETLIRNAPDGKLRASKRKSGIHYYRVFSSDDICGEYISLRNELLISQLANKGYAERFLKAAEEELNGINRCLESCSPGKAEEIYFSLNQYRKPFVTPILMTDDEYLTRWQKESFKTCEYRSEEKIHETNRHEFVRSKSEKDIANLLDSLGIPYRYEAELVLKNGAVRYPDFTLLNVKTRENIYYEHFGLLDDSGYRRDNLQKVNEYIENGIILGRNFIFSFEAQGSPLNLKNIRRMLCGIMDIR